MPLISLNTYLYVAPMKFNIHFPCNLDDPKDPHLPWYLTIVAAPAAVFMIAIILLMDVLDFLVSLVAKSLLFMAEWWDRFAESARERKKSGL